MLGTLFVLLLALNFASAEPVTGAYASVDQNVVRLGQLAIIRIEPHPNRPLAISIADGTNTFRYNGQQIGSTIGFQPQQTGEHSLIIRDAGTGEALERLSFLVAELRDETTVPLDEIVPSAGAADAATGAAQDAATNATAQDASGAQASTARATRNATRNATQNSTAAGQDTVLPTRTHLAETDKQSYALGEPVNVSILAADEGLGLNIIYGEEVFRFLGDLPRSTLFQPKAAGAYRIVVSGPQGAAIDSLVITVSAPMQETGTGSAAGTAADSGQAAGNTTQHFTAEFRKTAQRFKVRDAHNNPLDGMLRIMERGKAPVSRGMLDAQAEAITGPADIEYEPLQGAIKRVHVSNMVASTLNLGIDEFTGAPTQLPAGKDERKTAWSSLYAIDPTMANASSVTLIITASGDELHTCKDWDYANRACLGAWVKVRNLVPGENYTVTVDPADPGFGETISIPSGGWTETATGTNFHIRLCDSLSCSNVTTTFQRGETMYVMINTTGATSPYIRTTAKNQFDIYYGSDTGSVLSVTYANCTPTISPDGPFSYCEGHFTIPDTWADGWYYIDSQQHRTQGGGIYANWRAPFVITSDPEPAEGDTLRFFADANYQRETVMFTTGQQVYVEFNFSAPGQTASAANTVPYIRNIKTLAGAGTAVTESFSRTTGPYRFNFSMPNMATAGWYIFDPRMQNTSAGALPDGPAVHGRMILFRSNTGPSITRVTTNSPPSDPLSVGESLAWNISISDPDEIDRWVIFICANNSFNTATMTCVGSTLCSDTAYSPQLNRTCERPVNRTMNVTNTNYAFVCDARACSAGSQINWSIINDTAAPSVTLVTPVNDPGGAYPKGNFTQTFNFIASDDYRIANCTLHTNATGAWTAAATNFTIANGTNSYITHTFGGDGAYKWNVLCADPAGNTGSDATNYTLHIAGPPIVTLISPSNGTYSAIKNLSLSYNVTYGRNITGCSLYINGALNQTVPAITRGATESFPVAFDTDGMYGWNVLCTGDDGIAGFGDGVLRAGTGRVLYIDTQAPVVTLMSPQDGATISAASASFIYQANDTARVANCSLYVDGVSVSTILGPQNNVNQTIPFLLNNGNHPWYVTCVDAAANAITSPTRTVTVNASSAGNAQLYETDYGAAAHTPPASVNLSAAIDATQELITANVPRQTMKIFSKAITAPFQGNGIIVSANSTVSFSGDFSIGAVNSGYATWKLYKSNSMSDTLICQAGDDSTGGTALPSNGRQTGTASCTAPATNTRLLGTEWIKLQVDIYNSNAKAKTMTHYIDSLSSFVSFNFTRLGVLTTTITVPSANLTIGANESFELTCAYNCSGGACLNTRVYAERNTTAGWQQVPASGGVIILNPGETNPHALGTVAFPGGTTTFTLNGSTRGSAAVRCNATSDYSAALLNEKRVINVGAKSVPTVVLLTPANRSFINTNDITLTFLPSSNKDLDSCTLSINGVLNQTNTSPAKDAANGFAIYSVPEAAYNWSVSCADSSGTAGNSTNYTFTVDRGPPTVDLNGPDHYSNFTTDTIMFNWTAADTTAAVLRCDVTIDGAVRATNVNSQSGYWAGTTIGGLMIGTHYWNVSCVDPAGNVNTSATRMLNITNLPTNVTLLGPPNAAWTNAAAVALSYNVTHQISRQPANCSLYVNNLLNQSNTTPIALNQTNTFSVTTFTDALYGWKVQCVDADGTQNTSSTRYVHVDRTVPFINLTSPPDSQTLSIFNIPFTFRATDNLAPNMTCNLSLDGVVNVSNLFVRNNTLNTTLIRNIADGAHAWNVSCVDLAGNANRSLVYAFTAIAPPNVTLISPKSNGHSSTSSPTLTYNVSENNAIAGCVLYFDGALDQANQTPVDNNDLNSFSVAGVAQGLHNWSVSCTDASGYVGNSPVFNLTIDTTKPIIDLNLPVPGVILRSPVAVVNWTAYDNIDPGMLCNVTRVSALMGTDRSKANVGSANGTPAVAQYSGLPDDQYWWNVTCWDDAGNANSSETWTFNISRLPIITLVSPAEGSRTNDASVTFTYDVTQSSGIANCTLILDGAPSTTNSTVNTVGDNYFYAALDEGLHNWSVNCTDNTGGIQNSSALRFTVDLTPPSIDLVSPADRSIQANNTIRFSYNVTDTQSTAMVCNLTVNGTVYSPNQAVANSTLRVGNIPLRGGNASYSWNVTCRDNANNYNISETRTFNIIAPPDVRLVSPANNRGASPNTSFVYYAADPFGIQNCSLALDGVVVNSSASIANATSNNLSAYNIPEGPHTWTVLCYDNDNESYAPPPFTIISDFDPPVVLLNAPGAGSVFPVGNVTFNWTAYDDTSLNITCSVYVDGVNRATNISLNNTPTVSHVRLLPDGVRSWNVSCDDQVGNRNTSATRQLTVNQTPTIAMGAPGNSLITNNGTVMFTFTPYDNDGFGNCSILLNGAPSAGNQTPVRNNATNNITISLGTARYNWSVLCADNGTYALENQTANRSLTVNLIPPFVELINPQAGLITNLSSITFSWNATETFGGTLSCNLAINGTVKASGVSSTSGMMTTSTINSLNDSYQVWNVTCTDPAGNVNTSATRDFTITAPPSIVLTGPPNGLRTNNLTVNFTFTATDNSGLLSACSLMINGEVNRTITAPSVAPAVLNFTVPGFTNASYAWSVNCTDRFGNMGNTTNRTLHIDTIPPSIDLAYPPHLSSLGTNVTFNWTAYDTTDPIRCNLTLDGVVNASNIAGTSGNPYVRLVPNVPEGPHSWNVTCWDNLNQANTSATYNFSVNSPDLVLNETARLSFNNTNPDENDTIRISANVTNIGGVPAVNAVISFWDGDPDNGGASIANVTVNVQQNQSIVASVPWNISLGFHTIHAVADYGDLIIEMDDSNNRIARNISVLRVTIGSPQNATMTNNATPGVNFTVQNFTGGEFTYTVFVDGARTGQNGTVTDNVSALVSLNALSEGIHRVIVQANDTSRAKNSTPLTIITDLTPPAGAFLTQNNTFFSTLPLNVTIRLTDAFDPAINYTLFVNGTAAAAGFAPNATGANATLDGLANGSYQLIIQSYDDAGNIANSTPITIYIDNVPPYIELNSPAEAANFSVRNIRLNFTPTDNLDPVLQCSVTLDDAIIASFLNVTSGNSAAVTTAALGEGTHYWNATCWDGNNGANQVNMLNTSALASFNIYIPPDVTLIAPANNTLSGNATQAFAFNVTDETGLSNCSLVINGAINATKTTAQLALNTANSFTVDGLNNTMNWSVICTDNSTGLAAGTSGTYNLTIDSTPPNATILTANNTWFSTASPAIRLNATDNYAGVLRTTIFVDGVANVNGNAASGALTITSLTGVANGTHTIIVQANDTAGNMANSTPITIYVDTVPPDVTLIAPEDRTNLTSTAAVLNFTASDNMAAVLACSLTFDGAVVQQYNLTNASYAAYTAGNLASGWHQWNATCSDNATNTAVSPTFSFFVQLPDFVITAGNISLSNSTPIENQTIEVNATVLNIGQLNYTKNITAQFWLGDPQSGGRQLGGNITIEGLNVSQGITLRLNYTAIIGLNALYVVVDPPIAANGSIMESNETNNKAHTDFWVGLFEVFAGSQNSNLHIADSSVIAAFIWNETTVTGSNVFVADTDSVITFTRLQAIGRNATNGSGVGADDFEEIDARLNTTMLNDSVNLSFTAGSQPIGYRDLTAFKRTITDVPVINSTNTSSFATGILWDMSDGGSYYNTSQDIVFVTVMNQSQQGRYGVYDYEIAVPAKLRDYVIGGGTVTFYTELR